MANLYVDFNKLIASIDVLEGLDRDTKESTLESIENSMKSIIQVGNNHDSCFSDVSADDLTTSVEQNSQEIKSLITEIENVIQTTLDYSCQEHSASTLLNNQKIDKTEMKGLTQALIWKMNNTSVERLSSMVNKNEITAGYNVEFYNNLLKEIQNSDATQREKITATAIFMVNYFPHLPYFWGSGHRTDLDLDENGNDKMGVNDLWGTTQMERHYDANGNLVSETPATYGIDCSGFVNFVLRNNGYDPSKVNYDCNDESIMSNLNGNIEPFTTEGISSRVQAGDIIHMNGHIGMVVKVDGDEVTIAHSSGGIGLGLTTMNTQTGLVTADSSKPSRVGEPYFTEVKEVTDY